MLRIMAELQMFRNMIIAVIFAISLTMPACVPVMCGKSPPPPDWLHKLIQQQESQPVANPPASITSYKYNGQVVYFLPQQCCEIPSTIYDFNGNVLCHPDGGISGKGDMKCSDFFEKRTDEKLIWKDSRSDPERK